MGSNSIAGKIKGNRFAYIAFAAVLAGGLFSFFHVSFWNGSFDLGWYSLPIDPDAFSWALDCLGDGDASILVLFPLYLLRGVLLIALTLAPYILLAVSFLLAAKKRRLVAVISAQVIVLVRAPIGGILQGGGIPDLTVANLFLYCLIEVVFVALAVAPRKRRFAAAALCVALCVVFLVLMVAGIPPFGYESSYFGKSFHISSYIAFASLWVASALSIESLAAEPDASSSLGTSSLAQRKRAANASRSFLEAAVQIKELKSLLDADILTQEEFDAKKAELLNLGSGR